MRGTSPSSFSNDFAALPEIGSVAGETWPSGWWVPGAKVGEDRKQVSYRNTRQARGLVVNHNHLPEYFLQPLDRLPLCDDIFVLDNDEPDSSPTVFHAGSLVCLAAVGALSVCTYSQPRHFNVYTVPHSIVAVREVPAQVVPLANQILADLSALEDDWDSDGSLKPSGAVLNDFTEAFKNFALEHSAPPETEIDDDGRVSMYWRSEPRTMTSFNFGGTGKVVISHVNPDRTLSFARAYNVTSSTEISAAVMDAGLTWAVKPTA